MATGSKDFELILRVQADLQAAVSQLRTLNDQMRVTKSAAVEASGGLASIKTSALAAESGIRNVGTQATALNDKLHLINNAAHALRNAFVYAFAIHELATFTRGLSDANVEAQRIQNTMEQAFGKDGAAKQLEYVRNLSQELGLDFKAAAEGFAGLGASAQGTGIQTNDLRRLFTGLSEAATVLHSSTQDVNGVMVQLGQAMSLGKLQMQDIRAIAQHLPGTMTALSEAAKRLGVNLSDALKSGGLEAKQFIGILGDVLQERFGEQAKQASHSLNSELQRLHTTFFELQTDGTGFADSFAGAIHALNDSLNDPGVRRGLQDLVTLFGQAASAAVKASAEIGQFLKYVMAMQSGAASKDLGGLLVEQDDIRAELRQRAEHPTLSAVNTFLAGTENNFLQNAWEGGRPRIQSMSTAQLNARLAKIQAQVSALQHPQPVGIPQEGDERGLFAGLPKPGAAATPNAAATRAAAQLAKQAAAAQADLTQALIALQGQLDPTAAIYAKYNAAVEKATADAVLAKQAKGADAQAIDAQRDAVVQLAGTIRDAALDQLAEKDRQAWEALKRSFETPAQVAVDDALKKIAQLNDLLKKGRISSAEYHDALAKIGEASVTAAPQYQGPDAAVSGAFGELQKNSKAMADLEAWHQSVLAANASFHAKSEAEEEAHQARMKTIEQTYSTQRVAIEKARAMLTLQASEEAFGQLAALTSSNNKTLAAIGRAAALVQAGLSLAINIAKASEVGFPLNIGFIAGAVAQGAEIYELISQAGSGGGGYADGGYTGTGGKHQIAGIVHAGEVVFSQADIARFGGVARVEMARLRGYADGGFVHPLANVPSPAAMGFAVPTRLPLDSIAGSAASDDARAQQPLTIRNVLVMDPDVIPGAMTGQRGERVTMTHIKANIPTLRAWINGKN